MNKAIKIVSVAMLVALVIGMLATPVLATSEDLVGQFRPDTGNTSGVTTIFNSVIGIVQVVGTGIAIIMLIVLAIKYLTAAPEGKAEIKKSAIIYVVAAVILFAAVNILAAIQGWAQNINIS